jgi:phosphoesterase RecJ-like protein
MSIGPLENQTISELRETIERSKRIVITCHEHPDGDAMGSSLGLSRVLNNAYPDKIVNVITPDVPPKNLYSIPGASQITVYKDNRDVASVMIGSADLIICLDFNEYYRLGETMGEVIGQSKKDQILIDHHLNPKIEAVVCISRPEASSTCELLYRVLTQLGLEDKIDKDAAECIFTGMMTDTGNFSYNSGDPYIYFILSKLMERGIEKDRIVKDVFNTYSYDSMMLQAYAVYEKMGIYIEDGAALIVITNQEKKKFNYQKGDTEGLVNKPLAIPGVVYSVFLREDDDYVKVSMRSVGEFPVNEVCEQYYGGGGHKNASGGEYRGTIDEAVAMFHKLRPILKKKYLLNQ